jgi:hypothetical protein
MVFSELGQKLPFPADDHEARPAPSPMMVRSPGTMGTVVPRQTFPQWEPALRSPPVVIPSHRDGHLVQSGIIAG